MSAEYTLAKHRGEAAGYSDGLDGFREPYPKAQSKAEYAGYATGYDAGFARGYEIGISLMMKQYLEECQGPPDPRLMIEIGNRNSKPFCTPDELDRVLAIPSHLKK